MDSTVESTEVVLIPQTHGGALRPGGKEGNNGGRPPSVIRKAMREALADRLPNLLSIADESERDSDKLKALDLLAKYGIGTVREISYDEVKQRLADTVALLRNRLGDEAEPLIRELEPIWRVKK